MAGPPSYRDPRSTESIQGNSRELGLQDSVWVNRRVPAVRPSCPHGPVACPSPSPCPCPSSFASLTSMATTREANRSCLAISWTIRKHVQDLGVLRSGNLRDPVEPLLLGAAVLSPAPYAMFREMEVAVRGSESVRRAFPAGTFHGRSGRTRSKIYAKRIKSRARARARARARQNPAWLD